MSATARPCGVCAGSRPAPLMRDAVGTPALRHQLARSTLGPIAGGPVLALVPRRGTQRLRLAPQGGSPTVLLGAGRLVWRRAREVQFLERAQWEGCLRVGVGRPALAMGPAPGLARAGRVWGWRHVAMTTLCASSGWWQAVSAGGELAILYGSRCTWAVRT